MRPELPINAAGRLRSGLARRARTERDFRSSRSGGADVAVFHEFHAPPYGGGNQFLLALVGEFERRGLVVETNRVSGQTPACLYNSFNFDFDVTILQSQFSLEQHRELGIELRNPVVVRNSVDPAIFHSSQQPRVTGTRLRVITTSWSANPRKGADVLSWIDRNLDFDAFDVTFAGNTEQAFRRIRVVEPLASRELADLLREHDVYLAASRSDPCSNALLEALACGLPAAFLRSGGHPELVGEGGVGFDDAEELPDVLRQLRAELGDRRALIRVPSLAEVADRYLDALRP
jgi:glycosyltransferase involved in cell wall biosynthesis